MSECHRCAADPQPENFGSRRQCAFDDNGAFTKDNWNCATISEILNREHYHDRPGDESVQVVNWQSVFRPEEDDFADSDGWIVMTRYKTRGRTDFAGHLTRAGCATLTLAMAEAFLARKPYRGGREP